MKGGIVGRIHRHFGCLACFASLLSWSTMASAQQENTLPEAEIWLPLSHELRMQGVHGELILKADLAAEQEVSGSAIEKSSGSQMLDEFVITALETDGLPDPYTVNSAFSARLKVKLYAFNMSTTAGREYSCDQAVRDYDWHRATFGDKDWVNPLISYFIGLSALSSRKEVKFLKTREGTSRAIEGAIEKCRSDASSEFVSEFLRAGNDK